MSDKDATTTTTTTADTPATTDQASGTPPAALDETAATADTADMPEAAPAAPAKPWDGTDSLDVHVKLEHLWAWAQAEMGKLHARIDALIGGQGQNVETPTETPPAKEA